MAKNPELDKLSIEELFNYPQILSEMRESGYTRTDLEPILKDFEDCRTMYDDLLQRYVQEIRLFHGVHSTTSRVKSVGSLCEKILRKRDSRRVCITLDNYRTEIKDLLGIRALYVFPEEFAEVDNQIYEAYSNIYDGNPEVRYRKGDTLKLFQDHFSESRVSYNDRDDYRSIHYTLHHKGDGLDIRIELQTRTIFEEGWSEINHRTVYGMADRAKSQSLNILSSVLSRMVGTCNDTSSLIYAIAMDTPVDHQIEVLNEGSSGVTLVDDLQNFIDGL